MVAHPSPGESMEPTLENRALILVDFQRTVRRHNKIFAVRTEDGPVVKRLQRTEDGWQLVSDNKAVDGENVVSTETNWVAC